MNIKAFMTNIEQHPAFDESVDVLVLGIGNILWADEGFGPRCVEAFSKKYSLKGSVKVMDGGTLGMYLLNEIVHAKSILLFDCCDFHEEPGTLKILRDDEVAPWASTKISPHQTGFQDLLASAALLGRSPERLAVVGVQPDILDDYGGSLTPKIKARVDEACGLAAQELKAWGIEVVESDEGQESAYLGDESLLMKNYEDLRPDEESACRTGDPRFMVRRAGPEG